MVTLISRRAMLAGAASSVATGVFADAPFSSVRPVTRRPAADAVARMIRQSGLSGQVGFVVKDLASGDVLDAVLPDTPQPPASVLKAFTALYAIETLGSEHRFATRVIATKPVVNGVLDGDLILAGGGNPNLVTDELATLAKSLKESGLREVKGDFLVWDNALSNIDEIDAGQDDYLGYNPTITGLNLNYNRVHFEWKREGAEFVTQMDARSENFRPAVTSARIRVVDRPSPVFTYRDVGDVDQWTVARRALNNAGSRWLPVRHPAQYCGEVFATIARSHGIVLKPAKEVSALPTGSELAVHESDEIREMMRGMLRFSTNLTAEAAGLASTAHILGQNRGLRLSAGDMAVWSRARAGATSYRFVDHSGLGDASRVTAAEMVQFLSARDVVGTLRPIMKTIPLVDDNRDLISNEKVQVRAKTGTLNFVSSLAGYLQNARGQNLAFTFFAADLEARESGKRYGSESPPGSRSWNTKAKALQQQILRHWAFRG